MKMTDIKRLGEGREWSMVESDEEAWNVDIGCAEEFWMVM